MKRLLTIISILLVIVPTFSQPRSEDDADVISLRGSFQLMPVYQHWSLDSTGISEASTIVSFYQPISNQASISMRGAFASASGDVASLNGATDIQVAGSYYLETSNMIFSLALGIPVGKKKLIADEFMTSILLASNTFRFPVSQFGTGFNASPGVVWALPVSDNVVMGLGATYQYRGTFQPLADLGTFDPGDEILGTAGIDLRLDETSNFSADIVYTHFGKDLMDGKEIYISGDKVLAAIQYKKYFGFNSLFIGATFRSKGKSEIALGTLLEERLEPNQAEVFGTYTARFSEAFFMQFSVEGRFFQESSVPFSGYRMIGAGVMPEFSVSENVSIPLRFKFTSGTGKKDETITGVEAGLGLVIYY